MDIIHLSQFGRVNVVLEMVEDITRIQVEDAIRIQVVVPRISMPMHNIKRV